MDEDIVYSMIERHSGKASQPITTRSSATSSLILNMREALVLLGPLLFLYKFLGKTKNFSISSDEFYNFFVNIRSIERDSSFSRVSLIFGDHMILIKIFLKLSCENKLGGD